MSTGRLVARWLTLDPAARHSTVRPRPEVPRQRTWQEGRWHEFFHADVASPGRRISGGRTRFFTPSTT